MMAFVRSHASLTKHARKAELIQLSRLFFFLALHQFMMRFRADSPPPPGSIPDAAPRSDVQPARPESEYHPGHSRRWEGRGRIPAASDLRPTMLGGSGPDIVQ